MEMIRAGVISDTHGLLREEVMNELKQCDYIIHGGDIGKPEIADALKKLCPLIAVRGNNDQIWARYLPDNLKFNIEMVKFYLVHDKKQIPKTLKDTDVVIFGHSHRYFCEKDNGILWLNPGSCGKRRFNLPLSMAILTIVKGNVSVEKVDLPE